MRGTTTGQGVLHVKKKTKTIDIDCVSEVFRPP